MDCGLICCIDKTYSNVGTKSSKRYVFNEKFKEILDNVYNKIDIDINVYTDIDINNKPITDNRETVSICAIIRNDLISNTVSELPDWVKFSSKIRKISDYNDEEIRYILMKKYDIFQKVQENMDYENRMYLRNNHELLRKADIKITRCKTNPRMITKIGIRDTSSVSNLKDKFKTQEERDNYNKLSRLSYLNNYFGKDN